MLYWYITVFELGVILLSGFAAKPKISFSSSLSDPCSPPGTSLELCPSPSSCCSSPVEEGLGSWAARQYRERLNNWTLTVAQEMDTRATQVDGECQPPFSSSHIFIFSLLFY